MNCSRLCFLCSDSKTEFINLSLYHGTCGKHNLDAFITCIHCGSLVPIIKIQVPHADIEIIDNKEQAIFTIELKLDPIDRPQEFNESFNPKHFLCQSANKAEKIEFEEQFSFEIINQVDESSGVQEFKEFEGEDKEELVGYSKPRKYSIDEEEKGIIFEHTEKKKFLYENEEKGVLVGHKVTGKCPFIEILKLSPLLLLIGFACVKRHGIFESVKSYFLGKS